MLYASFVMGCYLAILVFLAVTQNAHLLIRADLLDVSADNKMIQIREGAMDDLLTGRVRLSV